jgi:integrase
MSRLNVLGRLPGASGVLIDEIPFLELQSEDIAAALGSLDVAPVTRESYRLSISAVYTRESKLERERAEKERREPRWLINPASLVDRVEDDEDDDVRAATNEEVRRLLAAAELYQVVYVLLSTQVGIRQGEFQHLRYTLDLDLETGMLRIQRRGPDPCCPCKQCTGKGWKPKTKRSGRSFHIPLELQALHQALLSLLEMFPVKEGEILFRNPRTGRPWTTKALQDDFKALCERAGVVYGRDVPDGITWHSMRHTCATNLVRAGVPLKKVADILGDTVETVERYYVKLDESDLGRGLALGAAIAAAA